MKRENDAKPRNLDLGQHFMVDPKPIKQITRPLPENSTVIEIGAGIGNLTIALAERVHRVVAVEIDEKFKPDLRRIKQKHRNIEIVIDNALSSTVSQLIKKESSFKRPVYIVSNLPYNITEPFIIKAGGWAKRMILTVGKKYGFQATMTDPSDPKFGELAFITKAFFDVQKIAEVPRSSFQPQPSTDSTILFFEPKQKPLSLSDYLSQFLIQGQKHGGFIKSGLREGLISYLKLSKKTMTKNEARDVVNRLNLDQNLLNKPFAQLNKEEIRTLATAIYGLKLN